MRCLTSALCFCLLTSSATAQTKKHCSEGQTRYRLQEFQEAGLLFNIAQCYRQMKQVFFHQNIDGASFTTLESIAVGRNPELLSAGDLEVVIPNADLQFGATALGILRGAR